MDYKDEKIKLEKYFSGDRNWDHFVETVKQSPVIPANFNEKLLKIFFENPDIAVVIYYRMTDDSLAWIERKVPALDNLTPLECLENPALIKRLKEALMRMH